MISFHVMAKPSGAQCNLTCDYCFYLDKSKLYPDTRRPRMGDEVLEAYTLQILAQPEPLFAWQGGEPTLMGFEFFRRAVELQVKHGDGKRVQNTLQTNGVLIDDEWAAFLSDNDFLVGLSIDGPKHLHDAHRQAHAQTMRALDLLQAHGCEVNAMVCVHDGNVGHPLEVYEFLRRYGIEVVQLIPVQGRLDASAYGDFLVAWWDRWYPKDVGKFWVLFFEAGVQAWSGIEPAPCVFRRTCGDAVALEHQGDVYSCDHYVSPEHLVGNVLDAPLAEIVGSEPQRAFGQAKLDTFPAKCKACKFLAACNGDCPKHRTGPDGESYLCAAYLKFWQYAGPGLAQLAKGGARG